MRSLQRGASPDVLSREGARWTAEFVASSASRPESKRYRHVEVLTRLRAISADKCFYCERPLLDGDEQVDHYRDVATHRALAFAWENLYLACKDCNVGKPSDAALPVASCADPCDPSTPPEAHVDFVTDRAVPVPASPLGARTIEKYKLNSSTKLIERGRRLLLFHQERDRLRDVCAREGRPMSEREVAYLRTFFAPEAPYSRAVAAYVAQRDLLR